MGIWLSQLMLLPTKWLYGRSMGIHSFAAASWKKFQICSTFTFSGLLVWKKLRVKLDHIWEGTTEMRARETKRKYICKRSQPIQGLRNGMAPPLPLSILACVALLVNLVLSLLFRDCEWSLLSAKNKRLGELHAPHKTRRTHDSQGAPKIELKNIFRCIPRVPCPWVSRGACISPAHLFLADVRDYSQFIFTAKVDLGRLFSS